MKQHDFYKAEPLIKKFQSLTVIRNKLQQALSHEKSAEFPIGINYGGNPKERLVNIDPDDINTVGLMTSIIQMIQIEIDIITTEIDNI